jgi:hypothetical protein
MALYCPSQHEQLLLPSRLPIKTVIPRGKGSSIDGNIAKAF